MSSAEVFYFHNIDTVGSDHAILSDSAHAAQTLSRDALRTLQESAKTVNGPASDGTVSGCLQELQLDLEHLFPEPKTERARAANHYGWDMLAVAILLVLPLPKHVCDRSQRPLP